MDNCKQHLLWISISQLHIGFVDMVVHALVQFILKFSQAQCAIRNANEYDLISIIKSFMNRVQITFCIKYCFELQSPLGSLHRHSYSFHYCIYAISNIKYQISNIKIRTKCYNRQPKCTEKCADEKSSIDLCIFRESKSDQVLFVASMY